MLVTKFAPVAPPKMLQTLKEQSALGHYHLLLAHDVLAQADAYTDVFDDAVEQFIIMDNSVVELGKPVSSDDMLAAVATIDANLVVLPDYIGDCVKTVIAAKEVADEWATRGLEPFMAVPQGQNLAEMITCANHLMMHEGVTSWGVPRAAVATLGSRQSLITALHEIAPEFSIHCLGFSDNLIDDIACARRECVMGIDSAVPIRLGLIGELITLDCSQEVPKRGDYWETAERATLEVLENLHRVRHWLNAQY